MPELPEVETTCQGIEAHLVDNVIVKTIIRFPTLRWPIPKQLPKYLKNKTILSIERRGKYILLQVETGTVLIHLGMSGHLSLLPHGTSTKKHDHVDIVLNNQTLLRYTDPRRFGSILWTQEPPEQHPLLKSLGPEPLQAQAFSAQYLYKIASTRKVSIKKLIMDSKVVVGVGNIYANEALFMANIIPHKLCNLLSLEQCKKLIQCIRKVLKQAIKQGGTTLKDFAQADGKPGYFAQQLQVYGKADEPCTLCNHPIKSCVIGQRSTFYCEYCQE